MIDLDELEKLAKEATPGPWHFHQDDGTALDISEVCIPRPEEDIDLSIASLLEDRDGAFIAAANPQVILELIERVRRAEARIAEAAKLHRKYTYYDLEDSCPDTTDEHREEHHHESDEIGEFYCDQMPTGDVCCDTCRDVNGDRVDWPCPTAVALGLNEGSET